MSFVDDTALYSKNAARVQWENIERIYVSAVWSQDNVPCYFRVDVAYMTGHMRDIAPKCTIAEARRISARLSALHDRPVRDWTLPAPPTIETEATFPLSTELPSNPEWGNGWQLVDKFFRERVDHTKWHAVLHHLLGMHIHARVQEGATAECAREEAMSLATSAHDRWFLLAAANSRQENAR
ncbi:hypothetical protein [Brytella acorum]|uniref:Uncharacterized protein n=1 Tax=Brytella acorum TaxID=2959299 RepID=A0AA35US75_9PROT|nr:hypothetical protein [Brytella acorum]MDF3625772.1 hypothetical protein [Brytella acorum]CAI9121210.1 hypothetical protein LMG32879_002056 [Brytella acorum]